MRRIVVFLCALCACVVPSAVSAQEGRLPITEGSRVRITTPSSKGTFVVAGVLGDTLILHGSAASAETVTMPLHSITQLEVARTRPRREGAQLGAGVGFLIGVVGGGAVGLASGDDPPGFMPFTAREKAVILGIGAGGAVGLIGGVLGWVDPGMRWYPVDLSQRVSFAGTRNGALAVTYSYRH
jgi:hypothetical protein